MEPNCPLNISQNKELDIVCQESKIIESKKLLTNDNALLPTKINETIQLAFKIVEVNGNDMSLLPQARAISTFMLYIENIPYEECVRLVSHKNALKYFKKLLNVESEVLSPLPRPIGIDLVVGDTAGRMQQSLNVKHLEVSKNENQITKRVPTFKDNILHSDSNYIWFRMHSNNAEFYNFLTNFLIEERQLFQNLDDICKYLIMYRSSIYSFYIDIVEHSTGELIHNCMDEFIINCSYDLKRFSNYINEFLIDKCVYSLSSTSKFQLTVKSKIEIFNIQNNVYEVSFNKTTDTSDNIKLNFVLKTFGYMDDVDLIFFSELKFFKYNTLLFISNFIKFHYCYYFNLNIFDPKTFEQWGYVGKALIKSGLYLENNNLTNMSTTTHGPLQMMTSERAKTQFGKFKSPTKRFAINEGARAMQGMDKRSDFAMYSNSIEIVIEVDSSNSTYENDVIKNII